MMLKKKRPTALDIAAKLPVAELLPMLANPRMGGDQSSSRLYAHNSACDAEPTARSHDENRSLVELRAENNRLRKAIAELSMSFVSQNSSDFAGK
jgi:hypothetical protein